ncbi:neuropeptide SIFamide [Agrilus planipennis]|uniref:Neuropeptide SIFamide n=1 Tax=Agrilus planipennis TaxID=224129 RepID=A0A1W4WV12_AGRPL|nr:neuropeptide SIFamide [Agrilus planipennis]
MAQVFYRLLAFLLVITLYSMVFESAEGTYRKPPFNGSIFGKRTSASGVVTGDYENANKAISAMCEIAVDACSTWFPSQEK